jgi:hypothetical protein
MFSAHGPVSEVPFSKCASGTGIVWSVRPGKACAGVIIPGVFRPNIAKPYLQRPILALVEAFENDLYYRFLSRFLE